MLKLKEKRMNIQRRGEALLDKAQNERRALREDEQKEFDELKEQLAEVEAQIVALEEEQKKRSEEEEEPKEEEQPTEAPAEEEKPAEDEEDREDDEEKPTEEPKEEECKRSSAKVGKNNKKVMEQISIAKGLRSLLKNEQFEGANRVFDAAAQYTRSLGVETGRLVIPTKNMRGVIAAGSSASGAEAIATDLLDMLAPLENEMILNKLGVTTINGAKGNIKVPTYAGTTVAWTGELGAASDGAGATGEATLQPYRVSAYIDLSTQFLLQDNVGAENIIRNSLISALAQKVEATVLGTGDGKKGGDGADKDDIISPKGLLNGVTAETAALTYAKLLDIEKTLESNKFTNNLKYACSIEAKAKLRALGVGDGTTSFKLVFDNSEILGRPAEVSGNIATRGLLLGDWAQLYYANWGGVELTVDPYSQAVNGKVRVVASMYVDAKLVRANAISGVILKA